MSDHRRPDEPTLEALATRWLALKKLARPSTASDEARRSDLVVIARHLADTDHPEPADDDRPALSRQLSRLELADLTSAALADALAAYAADHSPSTVRRVLSTWRGFCGWLRREGWLAADPTEGLEGPARSDWKPKPLELAELGRLVAAAITTDTRARAPWPERDRALVAVFVGGTSGCSATATAPVPCNSTVTSRRSASPARTSSPPSSSAPPSSANVMTPPLSTNSAVSGFSKDCYTVSTAKRRADRALAEERISVASDDPALMRRRVAGRVRPRVR